MLELSLVDPGDIRGHSATGTPTHVLAATIGYGANYFSAIRAEGRTILNNGSHRAYALREAGVTHAPCLIQQVSRREELELIGHNELKADMDLYLKNSRPPMLKDYFDPELRMLVHVPRTRRQIRVIVTVESTDVPAE